MTINGGRRAQGRVRAPATFASGLGNHKCNVAATLVTTFIANQGAQARLR